MHAELCGDRPALPVLGEVQTPDLGHHRLADGHRSAGSAALPSYRAQPDPTKSPARRARAPITRIGVAGDTTLKTIPSNFRGNPSPFHVDDPGNVSTRG